MIKKIIIFIAALLAIAYIMDYYGIIELPSYLGKPKVLETRDEFLYKTQKKIESELK